MIIDFATGLALDSREKVPEVYQVEVNAKGRLCDGHRLLLNTGIRRS